MLGDKEAIATIAVKDLTVAKKFYGDALGLKLLSSLGEEAVTYKSGGSSLIVYRSAFAGTNKATAANWLVGDDIAKIVNDLKAKGVPFEHYDMPGMIREDEVHIMGELKAAWFKDPDGNILSLMSR